MCVENSYNPCQDHFFWNLYSIEEISPHLRKFCFTICVPLRRITGSGENLLLWSVPHWGNFPSLPVWQPLQDAKEISYYDLCLVEETFPHFLSGWHCRKEISFYELSPVEISPHFLSGRHNRKQRKYFTICVPLRIQISPGNICQIIPAARSLLVRFPLTSCLSDNKRESIPLISCIAVPPSTFQPKLIKKFV